MEILPRPRGVDSAGAALKKAAIAGLGVWRQPHGGHGSSTCTNEVNTPNRHNAAWVPLCTDWLAETLNFHL